MGKCISSQICEEHYDKGARDSSGRYLIKGIPEEGVFNLHVRGSVGLAEVDTYPVLEHLPTHEGCSISMRYRFRGNNMVERGIPLKEY